MSVFPRIDPDHPLTQAARQTNDHAETHGLEQTLEWIELDVGVGELAYLSEQRALRAIASHAAAALDLPPLELDETAAQAIVRTPLWRDMRTLLLACYMDGIAIGWKAHEIADREAAQT